MTYIPHPRNLTYDQVAFPGPPLKPGRASCTDDVVSRPEPSYPGAHMTQDDSPRTRTVAVEWREQGPLFATKAEASGLEYLRALSSGEIVPPPVAQVLGIEVVKVDPGQVRFTMPVKDFFT